MKEYSLSDTSDSATAIIAYTIRAMNNCGFSKMQVDRYIKMIKSLSYNELLDLSNSILSSCNDYIKDLYEENVKMDKKLEARIARLEKMARIKNEWVRKHPEGNKLAEEADELNTLIAKAYHSAEKLKKHLNSYTDEANLDAPSKETISNRLNATIESLKDAFMMFSSGDYYEAFGDEYGFEMSGGDLRIPNNG